MSTPAPLKAAVKHVLLTAPFRFGLRRSAGAGTLLLYHRISPDPIGTEILSAQRDLTVPAAVFEKQLAHLAAGGGGLDLDRAVAALCAGTLRRPAAVVTFDDGYLDNLTTALPILERYRIPAIVYVTTDFIDGRALPWWDELARVVTTLPRAEAACGGERLALSLETRAEKEAGYRQLAARLFLMPAEERRRMMAQLSALCPSENGPRLMMNWGQLRQLAASPLITIGAHTRRHPNLKSCTEDELAAELVDARRILEEELGRPVRHLAYPYGTADSCGEREFAAAARAGYLSAVTTRAGHLQPHHAQHRWALPRMPVNADDLGVQWRWKLAGGEALCRNRRRPNAEA